MSATTVPSTNPRHVYGGDCPAWCRGDDCQGVEGDTLSGHGHPGDLAHDSTSSGHMLDLPLSLHSPFSMGRAGNQVAWSASVAEVRARQAIPGSPEVHVHLYGSSRRDGISRDDLDGDSESQRWAMDYSLGLTPREARRLAANLVMVADAIDNNTEIGAPATP